LLLVSEAGETFAKAHLMVSLGHWGCSSRSRFCTSQARGLAHPSAAGCGRAAMLWRRPGSRWPCPDPEVRVPLEGLRFGGQWLETTPVANGAGSKCILREDLVLRYLGTDNSQGRQAPTCRVFLHSQTIVTFGAHGEPVLEEPILRSETKAGNFLSKHYDPRSSTVVTPAAATEPGAERAMSGRVAKALFISSHQNAQTLKIRKTSSAGLRVTWVLGLKEHFSWPGWLLRRW